MGGGEGSVVESFVVDLQVAFLNIYPTYYCFAIICYIVTVL